MNDSPRKLSLKLLHLPSFSSSPFFGMTVPGSFLCSLQRSTLLKEKTLRPLLESLIERMKGTYVCNTHYLTTRIWRWHQKSNLEVFFLCEVWAQWFTRFPGTSLPFGIILVHILPSPLCAGLSALYNVTSRPCHSLQERCLVRGDRTSISCTPDSSQ